MQDHLQKDSGGKALDFLMKRDIVGLLCCPLSCGMLLCYDTFTWGMTVNMVTPSIVPDPIQGIQAESLQCVGQLGARNSATALALCASGVLDNIIISQTHQNPRIKVFPRFLHSCSLKYLWLVNLFVQWCFRKPQIVLWRAFARLDLWLHVLFWILVSCTV